MKKLSLCLLVCAIAIVNCDLTWSACLNQIPPDPCCPSQVHIALGDAYYNYMNPAAADTNTNSSLYIVWQTQDVCDNTYVYVTSNQLNAPLNMSANNSWTEQLNTTVDASVNNGVSGQYLSYAHVTFLTGLVPGVQYTYQVLQTDGSNSAGPYTFKVPDPSPNNTNLSIVIYADVDTLFTNATFNAIGASNQQNLSNYDMQIFLGDLAYNLYTESGIRGEYFYNTAQSFLATWPFMLTPGNHELYQNYSFLNFRTKMPLYNQTQNHYYSYNVGKVHFISINYYLNDSDVNLGAAMYNWVLDDLIQANSTREERPWIVVYTHQPIYCSYSSMMDPDNKRCYFFYGKNQIWDQLYYQFKVDLVLQGHVHYWERMGPTYSNVSQPWASWDGNLDPHNFINSEAPIYTIEGSGGNNYFMVSDPSPLLSYSLNDSTQIAYSTLTMVNDSALHYQHISSDDGSVIDHFYILKGPQYPNTLQRPPSGYIFYIILATSLFLIVVIGLAALYSRGRKRQVDSLEVAIIRDSGTSLQKIESAY